MCISKNFVLYSSANHPASAISTKTSMKNIIAITATALALLSSCANQTSSSSSSSTSEATPQIRKGMTKAQVTRAWGEPSGRQVTGSGEIWTWGGQRWKRMIPYAGPFINVQTSKVVFGSNGRVKDFRVTDHGDSMTDMEGYSGGHNEF